ncbi:MAG: helix-turn-helix transcriptional regulator [Dehalococcoidia bacterium]|nr:MAG: helix-turn-helix transcriptional regulator [Dehalococcoidia bacterium]
MDSKEFVQIRHYLGKTQQELARLLCISPRGVQSFEQGWRNISGNIERQLLFFLSLQRLASKDTGACWETLDCPFEWRSKCTAWEFKAGYFCWFVNGTFCQGKVQKSWQDKIDLCRQCKVYKSMLPTIQTQH